MIPGWDLQIAGKDALPNLRKRLVSLTMTDEAGVAADTLELELDAREDPQPPPVGEVVKLWLGFAPSPVFKGDFRIVGFEFSGPPNILRVTATAADFTSELKAPRMASYHDTTVTRIVQDISARHGLTAVLDGALASHPVEHLDQQNESDAAFLSRLARRQGATFKVAAGRMIFAKKGSPLLASGEAKQVITIKPTDVSEYRFELKARGDYKSASAEWFDRGAAKRRRYRTGTEKPHHRDSRLYGSEAEAKAAAEANLGDLGRGTRSGDFTAPGMPHLYADARVEATGFWRAADGSYSAVRVTHTLNGSGYTTSAELEGFNGQ